MKRTSKRALLGSAAALALGACAHGQRPAEPQYAGSPQDRAAAPERLEKVFVTGSHIPRPVDPRTGLPPSFSPLTVYTRDQLMHAGAPTDMNVALYRLDPALGR